MDIFSYRKETEKPRCPAPKNVDRIKKDHGISFHDPSCFISYIPIKGYALIPTNWNLSMLIFFVENNIHLIIHSFYLSGSVIAHFFVQMKISALLQNSIQAPVI